MDNLQLAFRKARKGKSGKWYVREFESNIDNELLKLKTELETQAYRPKPLSRFVIRDPKTRVIHASAFRDRVVHHALCNLIEPIIERTFIYDSFANRKKKGVHVGLERFDEFKRSVSQNGSLVKSAKDGNMVVGYALKADIRHYFQTVDNEILTRIISKRIKDEKTIWLIRTILANHDFKKKGKGMPIGNLTSQFFANVYLNELDYYVKHRLGIKFYMRYVDDFIILDRSKQKLTAYKWLIDNFIRQRLKLELHPDKTKIMPLHEGVNLLGFRIFYHYKLPRINNVRGFERKLEKCLSVEIGGGGATDEKVNKMLDGWFGYIMHGNTYKLRKMMRTIIIY